MLKLGGTTIGKIFLGNNQINAIYLGSNLVYSDNAPVYKIAGMDQRPPVATVTMTGQDTHDFYVPVIIGRDIDGFFLSHLAKILSSGGDTNLGNSFNIESVCLIRGLDNSILPIYTGGSRAQIVANGGVDIQTGIVLAALDRGETVYAKGRMKVTAGQKIPICSRYSSDHGGQYKRYDSSVITGSAVDAAGPFTYSGGTPTDMTRGYSPILIGIQRGSGLLSWLSLSDSNGDSVNDNDGSNGARGRSYVSRMMHKPDGSDPVASLNFSVSGATVSTFATSSTMWRTYRQYVDGYVDAVAGNDFQVGGVTAATVYSRTTTLWSLLTGGKPIIKLGILIGATSVNNFLDYAGQTVPASIGQVRSYNQMMEAAVVSALISVFGPMFSVKDPGGSGKTLTNGVTPFYVNADAIHVNSRGSKFAGDEAAIVRETFPITTSAPAALTSGQWSVVDTGNGMEAAITINALPNQNGSTISDFKYRVDGGSYISLNTYQTGTYIISLPANDVAYSIQVVSENYKGQSPASDTKSVTPTDEDIPPAGDRTDYGTIFGWYYAKNEASFTKASNVISAQTDSNGGSINLSQATTARRPTWDATGLLGQPCVVTQIDDFMQFSAPINWSGTGFTHFIFLAPGNSTGNHSISAGAVNGATQLRVNTSEIIQIVSQGVGVRVSAPSAYTIDQPILIAYTINSAGTVAELFINGVSVAGPTTFSPAMAAGIATLYGDGSGTSTLVAKTGEHLIYSGVKSSSDILAISQIIADDWGFTL